MEDSASKVVVFPLHCEDIIVVTTAWLRIEVIIVELIITQRRELFPLGCDLSIGCDLSLGCELSSLLRWLRFHFRTRRIIWNRSSTFYGFGRGFNFCFFRGRCSISTKFISPFDFLRRFFGADFVFAAPANMASKFIPVLCFFLLELPHESSGYCKKRKFLDRASPVVCVPHARIIVTVMKWQILHRNLIRWYILISPFITDTYNMESSI